MSNLILRLSSLESRPVELVMPQANSNHVQLEALSRKVNDLEDLVITTQEAQQSAPRVDHLARSQVEQCMLDQITAFTIRLDSLEARQGDGGLNFDSTMDVQDFLPSRSCHINSSYSSMPFRFMSNWIKP